MSYNCIVCDLDVRPRQEGLLCDSCSLWQHRTCYSGMTREAYRGLVKSQEPFQWKCFRCDVHEKRLSEPCAKSALEDVFYDDLLEISRDEVLEEQTVLNTTYTVKHPADIIEEYLADQSTVDEEEESLADQLTVKRPPRSPRSVDVKEESLADQLTALEISKQNVTYSIVQSATARGKDKLFDSDGYSYVVKNQLSDGSIVWRCSVRNARIKYCPAKVRQTKDDFKQGDGMHCHEVTIGAQVAAAIAVELKTKARGNPSKSARSIVNDVIEDKLGSEPCPALPSMDGLMHMTNYSRRPHPTSTKCKSKQ